MNTRNYLTRQSRRATTIASMPISLSSSREKKRKPIMKIINSLFALSITLLSPGIGFAQAPGSTLPDRRPGDFKGEIGETYKDSKPSFPVSRAAPVGAPNVLLILLDDVGFGATSTFGGPVPTPALDKLAAAGLRYIQWHTTSLCSPTRAALLTGRNHHEVGNGVIAEAS